MISHKFTTLEELMKAFNALKLYELSMILGGVYELAAQGNIPQFQMHQARRALDSCASFCNEYGLAASATTVERLIRIFARDFEPELATDYASDAEGELKDLHRRLEDELAVQRVLVLDYAEAALYRGETGIADEVIIVFPSASLDIEEAAKCLALGRATACVFHLMRVVEVGLYALAKNLLIQNPQENWQNAIEQIEKSIRGLSKDDPRKQSFSEATAYFHACKDAWRNRTAHSGTMYQEDKAHQVFGNVKAFMEALAAHLSEVSL